MTAGSIDERLFREVMGTYATGVTVIAAATPEGGVGITVNSFASVSLDPPLVLWCLGLDGARAAALRDAPRFSVSILHAGQEAIARRFAADAAIAPDDPGMVWPQDGPPHVRDARAHLSCVTEARHPGGDHVIIVGRVFAAHAGAPEPVLTYLSGFYGRAG